MSFVKEYFNLCEDHEDVIRSMKPEFGYDGFGEAVYYRTYSRRKPGNSAEAMLPETDEKGELQWTGQEKWADTVLRVVNGVFTIRKDWFIKTGVYWDEDFWQDYAKGFAISMSKLHWVPPGRGLWAMGTRFVYERGGMALNNCGYTELGGNLTLGQDYEWMMDALMMGVGVGFHALRDDLKVYSPLGEYIYDIPDTREGWARATRLLVDAFTVPGARFPKLKYHLIRPEGLPIRGFGGLSSGPKPLKRLHDQIVAIFRNGPMDVVRLKTDIANMIGCCVVSGNVRRSAELAMGNIDDEVFLNLKDWSLYPDREEYGGMSNNTVICEHDSDFELLGNIARRVPLRGEPGVANFRNFPTGRVGKKNKNLRLDKARGLNPCGEIPLENKELCNLSETSPTKCSLEEWFAACAYAAFYSSTTSLLPTHWANTNAIVGRNRRIGVGLIDYTGWVKRDGLFKVTKALRKGYKIVTKTNQWANAQAGIPEAIRKTTVKPGGTVSKLVGRTAGAGYPTFEYMIRRMRVAANSPVVELFKNADIPYEESVYDRNTLIFSFPVKSQGAKSAENVTIWEQANNLTTLQREWSDNSVSNTIYFKPKWVMIHHVFDPDEIWEWLAFPHDPSTTKFEKTEREGVVLELKVYKYNPNHEEDDIEPVLASILPVIKSCSLLPHTPAGVYEQMPEEGITEQEYEVLRRNIQPIDWTTFSGSDGEDERYCQGDACLLPKG